MTGTVYACQDRKNDIKAGVKSATIILGDRVVPFAKACSAVCVGSLVVAGYRNGRSVLYWVILVCAAAHLYREFAILDVRSTESCYGTRFSSMWGRSVVADRRHVQCTGRSRCWCW